VHPTIKGRKRFYKEVSVRVIPLELNEGVDLKYEVALDGRSLRTPGRRSMHFDSPELAWGVAAEWDAQVVISFYIFSFFLFPMSICKAVPLSRRFCCVDLHLLVVKMF